MSENIKSIMHVASEGLPFIKTGGLADVIGSLPLALGHRGYDVKVVLPMYKKIAEKFHQQMEWVNQTQIQMGEINELCRYWQYKTPTITYYFVEHQNYFERDGLYGYDDDAARFAFFQKAALQLLEVIDWYPDIIHCHDWHTGMIPALGKIHYRDDWHFDKIKYILTIHNLAFQGRFAKETLEKYFGLSLDYYHDGSMRFDEGISFLKTGIVYADKITTVSYTYSHEIQGDRGEGLAELLYYRRHDLWGIVNGIDYQIWNPATDKYLVKNYDVNNWQKNKKANKLALQKELGLTESDDVVTIGIVSRLTYQKGLGLVLDKIKDIMNLNIQFIILGTGEKSLEDGFSWLENNYRHRAVYYCGYNEELAHRVYAGCDLFLMPSLYEPCGIGQLIAMRYGALPIVRETGGLKDTVKAYNRYTNEGNGFSFYAYNADDMYQIIKYAVDTYYHDHQGFIALTNRALNSDVSWQNSVNLYEQLYWLI